VTAEGTFTPPSEIDRIFGPVVHAQTYRHLLYALVSFPLGILYFVSMITGLSVGIGTAIIVIGFVILALTLGVARIFARLERELAKALLGATFEQRPPYPRHWRAVLRDRRSWTAVVYLILRFPVSVAGFVTSVLMLAAVPVMAAPVLYMFVPIIVGVERVATSEEAMLVSLFGCILFLAAAHAVNGIAAVSRRLSVALL
jgi:hypothetical protein